MRWKVAIGGGESKSGKNQEQHKSQGHSQEAQNNANYGNGNHSSSQNREGRNYENSGMMNNNISNTGAYQNQNDGGSMNVHHPAMNAYNVLPASSMTQQRQIQNMNGRNGNSMMEAFNVGFYSGGGMGDMYPQNNGGMGNIQNSQMGYILDPGEMEARRRRSYRTRSEETGYGEGEDDGEVEMRRGRSRRTGRFVHRAEDDTEISNRSGRRHQDDEERGSYSGRGDDEERGMVEHLKRKIRKLEQRLEEGEESQEQVKHLKKKIKELEECVEELKEEKEKKREGRNKKEKQRGDDDDDEDDPAGALKKMLGEEVKGKEFIKFLPKIFQDSVNVIKSPPSTWPPYLEKKDYSGIYTMESKELQKAIEQYKAGTGTLADVMREVEHTVAAAVQLKAHLLQADIKPSSKK